MIFKKIDTNYVSPDDKFLESVDKKIPLSKSQMKEIAKAKRIAELRDDPNPPQNSGELWEQF